MIGIRRVSRTSAWRIRRSIGIQWRRHQRGLRPNIPAHEHEVVFMAQVVAVDHVLAEPLPEAQEDVYLVSSVERIDVSSAALQIGRPGRHAIAGQDSSFFQMDVYWVHPSGRG